MFDQKMAEVCGQLEISKGAWLECVETLWEFPVVRVRAHVRTCVCEVAQA